MTATHRDIARIQQLLTEKKARDQAALKLFRPMEHQEPFFQSEAIKRIIRGGNRCLGGEQTIYDPIEKKERRIDEIDTPFHVQSVDPVTGKHVIGEASVPFVKAVDNLYRFHLSNGESFVASMNHVVLADDGWQPLRTCVCRNPESAAVHLRSTSDTCLGAFPRDVPRWIETTQDSLVGYQSCSRSCGEQPHAAQAAVQASAPLPAGAQGYTFLGHSDDLGRKQESNRSCQGFVHPSILGGLLLWLVRFVASRIRYVWQPYSQPSGCVQVCLQSAGASSPQLRTSDASVRSASQGHCVPSVAISSRPFSPPCDPVMSVPKNRYNIISKVEYVRQDEVWDFEVKDYNNYVIAGIVHHNSGKSSCASAEFASAATGIPLHDHNGILMPYKYPVNRPLVMWVIGYDLDHLSRNIYRLLFQEGMFKVIDDLETGLPRAFRPWDAEDKAREKKAYPAPPLIPERFIEDWAWENKAQRVFKVCRLVNGTEIRAFSSMGKEPQGDQCDVVWIDEDVENDKLILEATMRILDRGGRMFWSAFPKSKNEALRRLSTEAAEADPLSPTCTETVLRMSDNPYLNQKAVKDVLAGLSDEERRSRDFGEFCDDLVAMFPTFDLRIHGIKRNEDEQDEIDRKLIENGLQPPDDWTRYLVLDPGHARPAVLFAAVPPPQFDPRREPTIVLYDEIAVPRIDAVETANLVEKKGRNQSFEAFIIDGHAGRQTSMGRGETTQQLYSQEFEKKRLRSRATGYGFIHGSDNVEAGIECIRQYLHINGDGRSRIRVIGEKCPNLCKQMELYKKTVTNNIVTDKPASKQVDDLVDCLRYLSAFNPQYRKPEKSYANYSPAYRSFLKFMGKKPDSRDVVCGPQYS